MRCPCRVCCRWRCSSPAAPVGSATTRQSRSTLPMWPWRVRCWTSCWMIWPDRLWVKRGGLQLVEEVGEDAQGHDAEWREVGNGEQVAVAGDEDIGFTGDREGDEVVVLG